MAGKVTPGAKVVMTELDPSTLDIAKGIGLIDQNNRLVFTTPYRLTKLADLKEGDFRIGRVNFVVGEVEVPTDAQVSQAGNLTFTKDIYMGLTKDGKKRRDLSPSFRRSEVRDAFIKVLQMAPQYFIAEGLV